MDQHPERYGRSGVEFLDDLDYCPSRVNTRVACLSAGGLAAMLACEAIMGTGYPKYAWAAGFWLLAVGARLATMAALVSAAITQHEAISTSGASASSLGAIPSVDPGV